MNHFLLVVVLQIVLFAVQTANVAPGTCWTFAAQDAGNMLIDCPFEAGSNGVDDLEEVGTAVHHSSHFLPVVFEVLASNFRLGEFSFSRTHYSRGPPRCPPAGLLFA
jgi:hypothetical protein